MGLSSVEYVVGDGDDAKNIYTADYFSCWVNVRVDSSHIIRQDARPETEPLLETTMPQATSAINYNFMNFANLSPTN